jgi:hypothetical protein
VVPEDGVPSTSVKEHQILESGVEEKVPCADVESLSYHPWKKG